MFKYPLKDLFKNLTEKEVQHFEGFNPSSFEERREIFSKYFDSSNESTDDSLWFQWLEPRLSQTEHARFQTGHWFSDHMKSGKECGELMKRCLKESTLWDIIEKSLLKRDPHPTGDLDYKILRSSQAVGDNGVVRCFADIFLEHHQTKKVSTPTKIINVKKFQVEIIDNVNDFDWKRCAIVSHRWKSSGERSKLVPWNDMGMSDKTLRSICDVLEKGGYEYVWVDTYTCSTPNITSAGLVELAKYYRDAHLTIVPLCISHSNCECPQKHSTFHEWYTRCWILQEIAFSKSIVFFGCNGELALPSQLTPVEYQTLINLKFEVSTMPMYHDRDPKWSLTKYARCKQIQKVLAHASYKHSFMDGDKINGVLSLLPDNTMVTLIPGEEMASKHAQEIYGKLFKHIPTIDKLDVGRYDINFNSPLMNHLVKMPAVLTHRGIQPEYIHNYRSFILACAPKWGPPQEDKVYCCVYDTVKQCTMTPSECNLENPAEKALKPILEACSKNYTVYIAQLRENKIGAILICRERVPDNVKLALGPTAYCLFVDQNNKVVEHVYPECCFVNEWIDDLENYWDYVHII